MTSTVGLLNSNIDGVTSGKERNSKYNAAFVERSVTVWLLYPDSTINTMGRARGQYMSSTSGVGIMVIISDFQSEDEGSIPLHPSTWEISLMVQAVGC